MQQDLKIEEKRKAFRQLHESDGLFVIPNPWDIGTSRILAKKGFKALATTSAGMSFALGIQEGTATMQQTLDHCVTIVSATALPVSADLENGFGDSPESVARCIRAAGETGLAGGSIEDHTGDNKNPIYDFELAVERIAAAVEASREISDNFVLTARCENYCWGRTNLDDTLRRLQAYENAGADVLYAPGLPDLEAIRLVCSSLAKPVNVVMGMAGAHFGAAQLQAMGVKRVSVGSALARAAFGSFVQASCEIADHGSFAFSDQAIGFSEMDAFFE